MATHVKTIKNDSELEKRLCLKSDVKTRKDGDRRNRNKEGKDHKIIKVNVLEMQEG